MELGRVGVELQVGVVRALGLLQLGRIAIAGQHLAVDDELALHMAPGVGGAVGDAIVAAEGVDAPADEAALIAAQRVAWGL